MSLHAALERWLARQWWRPDTSPAARAMLPLAALYGLLAQRRAATDRRIAARRPPLPVPVWVVGNVVVGGAGKTPLVLALVQALRAAGVRPGIVSRGYGREGHGVRAVSLQDEAHAVGDEALLLRRRAGVPVWVGRDRHAAALALLQAEPDVNLLLADDGLQHQRLARRLEIVVMDERGVGNGRLLPAGPLREPWPQPARSDRVLIHSGADAPTAGGHTGPALPRLERRFGRALPLGAWWQGDAGAAVPVAQLRGRPLLALAGIATPEKFFRMAEAEGLTLQRCPQPDHAPYPAPPWPPGTTEVVTTEKDAVKLPPAWAAAGGVQVWVLPLDSTVPEAWFSDLLQRFGPAHFTPRA
jgi:tetraacyldisaccharide 4'-kinase